MSKALLEGSAQRLDAETLSTRPASVHGAEEPQIDRLRKREGHPHLPEPISSPTP